MTARILVVDDVEANRRLLQAKLEARHHSVCLASHGEEALEKAQAEAPDIILLDVMMPGMDGYEVCRRLKADPAVRHIPVVMVTALSAPEDRVRGLEAGAEDFLTKPVDDVLLEARLNTLMRYNRTLRALRGPGPGAEDAGPAGEAAQDHEDEAGAERAARIFLIDDSPRRSADLAGVLRRDGHRTATLLEAGNLGDLARERADVLIVSLLARSFDPLALCAGFQADEVTRAVPLLLICDPQQPGAAVRGLELGASDLITAPVDPQELIARIRTQLRRTRCAEILRQRVDQGLDLAATDPLTGLVNRRAMAGRLETLMRSQTPLSVIMLDIDHFRLLNTTYGHGAGDGVLQQLAARLRGAIRPEDSACRPGGGVFLIILAGTPGDLACILAEGLRAAVAAGRFSLPGGTRQIGVTVSAGVAARLGPEDTARALLARAEAALLAAKSAGRNRVESQAA